jgi:predicted amidohydrolase YtcJ
MRTILRSSALAALAWLLSALLVPSLAQNLPPEVLAYADVVFFNGNVTTVDEKFSIKQAIAIRGNKILKVGTDAEALRLAGPNTRKIDLKGRSLIPGLIDSHSHVQATATDRYGKELAELPGRFARMRVSEAKNWASGKEDIRAIVKKARPGEWVIGSILRGTFLTQMTKKELDEVSPLNPIVVYERPSVGVGNTLAVKEIIETYGSDVDGLLKDDKGEPTGHVRKPLVGLLAYEVFPGLPEKVLADIYRQRMMDYPAVGITSISTSMEANAFSAFNYLDQHEGLPIRLAYGLRNIARDNPQASMYMKRVGIFTGHGNEKFWMVGQDAGSADGGLGGQYSAMCTTIPKLLKLTPRDYTKSPYGDCRINKGDVRWNAHMAVATSGGRITNTHVGGDKAHDTFLDLFQEVEDRVGEGTVRERRMAFDHCIFIRPDQVLRAAKMGVHWTCHTGYLYRDGNWMAPLYGKDKVEQWMTPLKSLLQAGMHVGWHTSSEFVTDRFPPMKHLQVMVTRRARDGVVYGPEERLTREEALRIMTMGSAYYMLRENMIGSLEEGKLADLVVLDQDFMKVPDEELSQIGILMTLVDGKPLFAEEKFAEEVKWAGIPHQHAVPPEGVDEDKPERE